MTYPPASILCATDLSPMGNAAVAVAYGLARRGTVVHLLHVVEPALLPSPFEGSPLHSRAPSTASETESRVVARLRALVPASALTDGVHTVTHVIHESDVALHVLAEARRVGAQLIVLGTHGRTGIGRILMGSVASQVARAGELPVLLVNERGGVAA